MISTGVVRRMDDLGRVVIPKQVREKMGFKDGTPFEIFIDGKDLVLKKYVPDEQEEE